MYPEYEQVNRLYAERFQELERTDRKFKDIFEFIFSKSRNNVMTIYYNEKKKLCSLKYKDIEKEVYRTAPILSNLIAKNYNDPVVLKMPNSVDWIVCFFAILMAGYRVLLLDAKASKDATENFIKKTRAAAIVCNDQESYSVTQINCSDIKKQKSNKNFEEKWADEIIFCTSGTTGEPKLLAYDGKAMIGQMRGFSNFPLESKTFVYPKEMGKTIMLAMVPFHHIFGFTVVFLLYVQWGATLVFPLTLAPTDIKSICQKVGVTHIFSVPLFWNSIVKELEKAFATSSNDKQFMIKDLMELNLKDSPLDKNFAALQKGIQKDVLGTSIRHCVSGGGFLSDHTLKVINGIGYPLHNGFGMTEIGIIATDLAPTAQGRLKNSIGKPFYSTEFKINKPDKQGQGELLVKSPYMCTKQIVGDKESKSLVDKEGFFHTGDIATNDEENNYYIKGRIKDVIINANGENIYPDELESQFKGLKHVINYSVLGINKDENEQKIVIVLEVDNTLDTKTAQQLVKEIKNKKLPNSARIDEVYFAKYKLPLSGTMKIQRFEIKNEIEAKSNLYFKVDEVNNTQNNDECFDKEMINSLKKIFTNVLLLSEFKINNNDHFIYDLGGNSLAFAELCLQVNKKFNIDIPADDYMKLTSINEFAKEIIKLAHK